jgi:hypothetical protein
MALAATVQWDVRTTGNDANGGGFDPGVASPGTDFSQQNSAQVAFTDLVIGATNTQLTSAGNPFSSASVGNLIQISAGTGFTTGFYTVASVSGVTATMDRAVGTASSTGGVGNLGGSLATIGAANTASASGNTINVKAGTYTLTATINVAQSTVSFIGYNATHNDGGTAPLITTATNSISLFNSGSSNGGSQLWQNLSLSNTAGTPAQGVQQSSGHGSTQVWVFRKCTFTGFTIGIDNSDGIGTDDVDNLYVLNCLFLSCTSQGIAASSINNNCWVHGCYFNGGPLGISTVGTFAVVSFCIFANQSVAGVHNAASRADIKNCTFFNCGSGGDGVLEFTAGIGFVDVVNCLFYGNNYGIVASSLTGNNLTAAELASTNNGFGNNTHGNTGWPAQPTDVTVTSNPFTNTGTGDFSLGGGGASVCKGAGYPGVFQGGTSTGHLDIGAVQSSSGGGGGGGLKVNPGMSGGING